MEERWDIKQVILENIKIEQHLGKKCIRALCRYVFAVEGRSQKKEIIITAREGEGVGENMRVLASLV